MRLGLRLELLVHLAVGFFPTKKLLTIGVLFLFVGCTLNNSSFRNIKKKATNSGITTNDNGGAPSFESMPDLEGTPNASVTKSFKVDYFDEPVSCVSVINITSSNEMILNPATGISLTGTTPDCRIELTSHDQSSGTVEVVMVLKTKEETISKSFKVSFNPAASSNTLPKISPIPEQVLAQGLSLSGLPLIIQNSNSDVSCSSSLRAVSSNEELISLEGITFSGAAPTCAVTLTPDPLRSGTSKITFFVSDGAGETSTELNFIVDPVAVGGSASNVVINGATYRIHQFSEGSSTFTVPPSQVPRDIEYLIVGGGGSRGGGTSGTAWPEAGGGGAVLTGTIAAYPQDYPVQVGSGGVLAADFNNLPGGNGGSSSIFSLTANGGLGGGRAANGSAESGRSGASGSGQIGGFKWNTKNAGGGGGAGGPASVTQDAIGGDGGIGIKSDISGTLLGYGGGGGGGCYAYGGCMEGLTTDGAGGPSGSPLPGRGGGAHGKFGGRNGGSGSVIVRYLLSKPNALPVLGTIADQITDQGVSLSDITVNVSDSDDTLSCSSSLSAHSTDSDLLPTSGILFSGTIPNCKMSLHSNPNKTGRISVTVTASDTKAITQKTFIFESIPTGAGVLASGGEISIISVHGVPYRVHQFKNSGADSFVVQRSNGTTQVEYLVVGGGGTCGSSPGKYATPGGGGAVLTGSTTVAVQTYPLTVGQAGKTAFVANICSSPSPGGASEIFGLTANGGQAGTSTRGGTSGSGNLGGTFVGSNSGGGGGAFSVGLTTASGVGGQGGAGIKSSISGQLLGYGGGGGGWGGGGSGLDGGATCCDRSQVARPHSGGGATGHWIYPYGDAASGVVIVRYPLGTPNTPPTVAAIGNQTTDVNTVLSGIDVVIGDVEQSLQCNTSLTALSGDSTALPNQNVVFSGTAPNCKMSLSPANVSSGAFTVTISVSDGKTSAQTNFSLNITP